MLWAAHADEVSERHSELPHRSPHRHIGLLQRYIEPPQCHMRAIDVIPVVYGIYIFYIVV